MATPIATVPISAVTADAARPLLDALGRRTKPGAIELANDVTVWSTLRLILALVATLFVVVGVAMIGTKDEGVFAHKDRAYAPIIVYLWLALWAWAGPLRMWLRGKKLPWKPGVYAIGPHIVDARRDKVRFFALTGVTADVDGDRSWAHPPEIGVTSTWKSFKMRISDRHLAVRVRDQLAASLDAARAPGGPVEGDVLAPLVAPSGAVREGLAGAVPRESIVLRFAWLTTAILAGAIGPLAVYLR